MSEMNFNPEMGDTPDPELEAGSQHAIDLNPHEPLIQNTRHSGHAYYDLNEKELRASLGPGVVAHACSASTQKTGMQISEF